MRIESVAGPAEASFLLPRCGTKMQIPGCVAAALVAVAVLALAGCSSLGFSNQSYIYNAEKDKQGQAALKAANEAKLGAAIDAAEKRNAQVLALELEAAKTRYTNIRELEIREVAFSDKPLGETWLARIDRRLKEIEGSADFQTLLAAQRALAIEERNLETVRDAFELAAGPAPDCKDAVAQERLPDQSINNVPQSLRPLAVQGYPGFRQACIDYEARHSQFDQLLRKAGDGSLLRVALEERDKDAAEGRSANAARKSARSALKIAQDAYNEATKTLLPGETNYAEKIAAAAAKLRQAIEGIEGAQKGLSNEVVAKERLDRIEDILNAVAGGNVDTSQWDPQLKSAVAVAQTLPALADEASRMLREAARPRLVPFELARQQQLLVVEEADKTNAVLESRIHASDQVVKAYVAEASTLTAIRRRAEKWRGDGLDKVAGNPDAKSKRDAFEALGIYFDDVPRYQLDERLWKARRLGLLHDEVIVHSKYAALMWQNLNEGIAATLAGYHGSGIKPETIAEFLKALGIVLIGVGVN